jgi:hypothetical protein
VPEFLDRLLWDADDIDVHDLASIGSVDDVHDPGEERLFGVAGDDQRSCYAG